MARGRAPNLSLPPTRQLANQRDYRARKAQYISGLEDKVKTLEIRVEDLEAELLQARLGGGATGMSSTQASELRSALLSSLNLVNQAYPQREPRAGERERPSSSSTPASLPQSPPLSIPSPAYPPPSALHRQPSFSPHQQQQAQQQYQPEPSPSTYFSQPQQAQHFGGSPSFMANSSNPPPPPSFSSNERKGGGSISTQSSSSQHSQDHQLGLIDDPNCCAGIFDCSPFPTTNPSTGGGTPMIVTSNFPASSPRTDTNNLAPSQCKPSSSPTSSKGSNCCPPPKQQQQQQQQPILLQQPQPQHQQFQPHHLQPPPHQQQQHHLQQQQQQQQQHPNQHSILSHPLLLLAQTSIQGNEEVCCDVETAMRDGCAPMANGGWGRILNGGGGGRGGVGAGGASGMSMRS